MATSFNNSFISTVLNATALVASLAQTVSNGASILGTLDKANHLPSFITGGNTPLPNGYPWSTASVENTNMYRDVPHTGVIREYTFTISRGNIAPDGVNISAILVNGAFPGPMIEANWGDTVQVTVNNQITGPEEGTLIHWHGLLHKGRPWMDGVPAVDVCPIAPGKSFVYTFIADLYGTSWWHSHYQAQWSDGVFGPMIIYGPKHVDYDIDLGPVMLSDHFYSHYLESIEKIIGIPFILPNSDNNLINGKMFADCDVAVAKNRTCVPNATISKFQFQTGKTHRLRLVNSGAEGIQRFAIDGHKMIVIANDFVPVVPYETDVVTMGIGQRTDILVKATGWATDSFWMRSNISTSGCSIPPHQPRALAAIYYPKANTSETPTSTPAPYKETSCGNTPLESTVPVYKTTPPATPATTQSFEIKLEPNETGNTLFYVNDVSFRANYDHPILLLAKLGNVSYPDDPQWAVYNFGSNSSIRLVFTNPSNFAHPMHLHGHVFWVLAEGTGVWDGTVVRPENPQRRDVQMLQGGTKAAPGYLVLEFEADNPGVWPMHCHIAWHVSTGLYVTVIERPDDIKKLETPSTLAQTCRDWYEYSGHNVVDQIDSGL